jgi:exodeoxyribonuclease VII large subunit
MEQADKKVFTLTQLGMAFENHVMDHFGSKQLWVVAEITKISVKSGHRYLELVDSAENLTTAQFSAYMWSRNFIAIKEQLGAEINEIFKPGNKALFLVKIEFHKVYGLKLNILSVDPQYTYGEIERRKKETLGRLSKEGLIDLQKSLYFPTLTKRIALVGSPNTSGFRDFKEVLFNNPVFRRFKLKQFSTSVQGDKAKDEIIAAIKKARCYDVDVIVLIRGGGSKMDLDIFNNYEICREICLTQIPVLTGIGHETDQVVADRVAHQFFITPTAVAKHLYVQIGNFSYFLNKYFDQVKTRSLEQLGLAKDEFQYQNKYLVHHTKEIINTWKDVFNEKAYRLGKNSQRLIHHEREELSNLRYKTHR